MDPVEVRNAADPEQVRRAARKAQRTDDERLAWYRAVLATVVGRAVCWDLIERAGIYRSVFSHDAIGMAYQAGRQDAGRELIAMLLAADDARYLEMESEGRARARRADAARVAAQLGDQSSEGVTR